MNVRRATLSMVFTATLAAGAALGSQATLDWHTIDGGGHQFLTSGSYTLAGTLGQADAAEALSSGEYELTGGFWGAFADDPFCFGDFNEDGFINLSDLAHLLGSYGDTGVEYEDGDLDGDGDIDVSDLAYLLAIYGDVCP